MLYLIRSLRRHEVYDHFYPRPLLPCQEDCVNILPSPVPWSGTTNIGLQDLQCLTDCTETNCLSLLFTDFNDAGGVCAGSYADVELNWPVSTQPCQMDITTSTTSTITSPNYPANYPNYADVYYIMTAPAGQSV